MFIYKPWPNRAFGVNMPLLPHMDSTNTRFNAMTCIDLLSLTRCCWHFKAKSSSHSTKVVTIDDMIWKKGIFLEGLRERAKSIAQKVVHFYFCHGYGITIQSLTKSKPSTNGSHEVVVFWFLSSNWFFNLCPPQKKNLFTNSFDWGTHCFSQMWRAI